MRAYLSYRHYRQGVAKRARLVGPARLTRHLRRAGVRFCARLSNWPAPVKPAEKAGHSWVGQAGPRAY
jgi:hypothetical protein